MTDPHPGAARRWRGDLAVALVLTVILTVGWTLTDWSRLSRLLLPDPDDMMRLAQVRDWLAGQGINDWTQYRMAPPAGAPMHWSRVNDVGIAGLILAGTPLVGRHLAELAAVLLYPALLFAGAVFLSARIGRRLWGADAGLVAAVLMAVAYPGVSVFIPGRIDHHALQVVLLQLLVLALMRAPDWRSGAAAGIAAALSLMIGLETVPQLAALIGVIALFWVAQGAPERARLAGFAAALAATTLAFLLFLRPTYWTATLCDAFTPASASAMLAVAAALAVLAGLTPWLPGWRARLALGIVAGAGALGGTVLAYPACIAGPYGAMDPFLRANFLPHIYEATGLFQQRGAEIPGIGGLLLVASGVSIWMVHRQPQRWATLVPLAASIVSSALVMLVQVRGVYIGAPLAAPMMAGLVLAARRRGGVVRLAAAWLAGAGMAYFTVSNQLDAWLTPQHRVAEVMAPKVQVRCSAGDAWVQVDRQPSGTIMAGTNVAAYVIGATHHATMGAGYHRNDAGNMAMYRFFLAPPERARVLGHLAHADYVLFCPGDFDEMRVAQTFPASLAAQLAAGRAPAWLEPLPLTGTPLRFYRIR